MTQRLPLVQIGALTTVMPSTDELPNVALPTNPVLKGLAGVVVPVGATTDRPASPANGLFRYNSTLGYFEGVTPNGYIRMTNILIATYRGNVGAVSGTSRIPFDNTVPQSTEGTLLWSKQVTPQCIGSTMTIEFDTIIDCSTGSQAVTLVLFRDTTAIGYVTAASTGGGALAAANRPSGLSIRVNDTSTSLTPVTYSCRVGNESSGTWYVGRPAADTLGGANSSGWKIDEVLQ